MTVYASSASSDLGGGLSLNNEETGQILWMDLALARQSGQELNNSYILTTSPAFGLPCSRLGHSVRVRCLPGCFGGTGHPPVDL